MKTSYAKKVHYVRQIVVNWKECLDSKIVFVTSMIIHKTDRAVL